MGRNLGPLNIKDSYEGLVQISGSLLTDGSGSLIPNLTVTASYATEAVTAISASYALTSTSASYAVIADSSLTSISASHAVFSDTAGSALTSTSASHALVADVALNVPVTASYAISSSHALISDTSTSASYSLTATSASYAVIADSSLTSISSSYADTSTSASFATTAVTASFLPADTNLNINSITASFASFTSASIGSLRTVTGSAVIIGDEFIILNADTPTARYAGLIVYDSGSGTPTTASFEWDGLTDNWIIVEESGDSAVVLTGPTGSRGSEILPTLNTLQKGNGHHTLIDSSISDDGTLVTINANISASGYVSASSFIGDGSQLTGISSDPFPYTGSAEITGSLNLNGIIITGNSNNVSTGLNSAVVGGSSNSAGGTNDGVFVGSGNVTSGTGNAVIVGGSGNTLSGGNDNGYYALSAGSGVVNSNGGAFTGVIGGTANTIRNFWGAGGDVANGYPREMYGLIAGGRDNRIGFGTSGNQGANGIPIIIGGLSNRIGATTLNSTGVFTAYSTILNSSASIVDSGSFQSVIGGYQNQVSGSDNAAIIHSHSSNIKNTTNAIILGGSTHNITSTGANSTIIGGSTHTISGGQPNGVIVGGQQNTVSGNCAGVFAGGANGSNSATGENSVVMGGQLSDVSANQSAVAGGRACDISNSQRSFIGGGESNTINSSGLENGIIAGAGCLISGTSERSAIIGSLSSTIASHDRSVIIGGQSLSTTKDNEVVVPSLVATELTASGLNYPSADGGAGEFITTDGSGNLTFAAAGGAAFPYTGSAQITGSLSVTGSVVGTVNILSDAAGTSAMDCSLGNFFTLVLPAGTDTEIVPSNIQAGQTINLKVTNNATPGTISFDSAIEFEGGTTFVASTGASEVDVLTFISFDGTSLQCVGVKNFS